MLAALPLIIVSRFIAWQSDELDDMKEQTFSNVSLYDANGVQVAEFYGLEPSWEENAIGRSCIPNGIYQYARNDSPTFGDTILVLGTTPRELVLTHSGNFRKDTRGCLILGMDARDIDADGLIDVVSSKQAMSILLSHVGQSGRIIFTSDGPL